MTPPQTTTLQLDRPKITEAILAADGARLVLFHAPAGFGKTSAMLQVRQKLSCLGIDTAWLTLDREDSDVDRFLNHFLAALLPVGTEQTQSLAKTAISYGADAVTSYLLSALAGLKTRLTFFLDDFESIIDSESIGILAEAIERLPSGVRFIIATRDRPAFPLGRLRARGLLLEFEPTELRFSARETHAFLTTCVQTVFRSADIDQLHKDSDGWPAALQLASIELRNQERTSARAWRPLESAKFFTYLREEIFERLPVRLQDFLLCTSILDDFNPSICNTLRECLDSVSILDTLRLQHLFITLRDSQHGTYRYQSLFSNFLRAELRRKMPHAIPHLHHMASGWYQREKQYIPAIHHAIEGSDFDVAIKMLCAHGQALLESGHTVLLSRWLEAMPVERWECHTRLRIVGLWAVLLTHGARAATPLMAALEAEALTDPEVFAHLLAARPAILALQDDLDEAYKIGRRNLNILELRYGFAHGVLANSVAHLMVLRGEYNGARKLLDQARRNGGVIPGRFVLLHADTVDALIDILQCRIRRVVSRLHTDAGANAPNGRSRIHLSAIAGIVLAEAFYESNQLDEAERLLAVYLPTIKELLLSDELIVGYRIRIRIALACNLVRDADSLLAEIEDLGHRKMLSRVVAAARLERARIALFDGVHDVASEEVNRGIEDGLAWRVTEGYLVAQDTECPIIARSRHMIHTGAANAAVPRIRREIKTSMDRKRKRRCLKLRILLSLAFYRSGHRTLAIRTLEQVLEVCAREGLVRIVLDEGPGITEMLRQMHQADLDAASPRVNGNNSSVRDYIGRLLQISGHISSLPSQSAAIVVSRIVLTPKESNVLRLLETGCSNIEIAERLFVTESTVRTHLRGINSKLGARSRTQAVSLARINGLIS